MEKEIERKGCKYNDVIYEDGAEFCIEMNCFRCEDGELHVHSGRFPG